MAKVTGIGGVFFKARDPAELKAWYVEHLGFELEAWGGVLFSWAADQRQQSAEGMTVWHLADAEGSWFEPSQSQLMINYRVDDLRALLAQLAEAGVECLEGPNEEPNGLFAWVMDPEGNKVELWEPRDPR